MKDKTVFVTSSWREELGRRNRRSAKVPSVRVAGEWLHEIGFDEGKRVTVSAEDHKLVLTVEE